MPVILFTVNSKHIVITLRGYMRMATLLVSGRVDESIKRKADAYIKRAGVTTSDVIKVVWEQIAETGEVPTKAKQRKTEATLADRLTRLRASTPHSEFLTGLTPEQLKEELSHRG